MKKSIHNSLLVSVISISLFGSTVFAAPKQSKKTVAASIKKATAVSNSKKKTVGELLAQINTPDRGAGFQFSKGETSLPQAELQFAAPKTNVNLEDVKPPRSSELFVKETGGDKAQYEKLLGQQIQELYKLTQQYKTSSNRGELWLRLAELYVEKAGLVDVRKQDEYDEKLKSFQQGKIKIRPKLDMAEARDYNKKAVQLYEWFVRDFPTDEKLGQAYFFLGYNHFELGDVDIGAKYYALLTKKFPQSPFVMEAYFALGEYYFENDNWAQAYKEYTPLLKEKKHRLNTMSLYKSAWCLYRLGKNKQALSYLEYIIKGSRSDNSAGLNKKQINFNKLEAEAIRDLVLFYAAEGDPNEAVNYFKSMVKGDVSSYLEKLAYHYSDKGNRDAARDVFKLLISENPNHPKAFEYQYQVVQNLYYIKNSPKFKEEMYFWIKHYGPESDWVKANQGKKDLVENANKLRETTLRNYVLQQHQTAQNSRAEFSRSSAYEGYQLYLTDFSESPFIGEMRFYFGELLFDMGKYDEAGIQYKWVVDHVPTSKFYSKAAANLILSVERSVPSDQELQKRIGKSIEPVELDPKVLRFIEASQWFVEKFPNSEKVPEIKFRVGRLYYQSNQFDLAEKSFREIVQRHSSTKYAEYSANLLLDIFNLKKDYIGLEKAGQELLAVPTIASSKAGADIRDVLEKASFKKGQDLEGQKKYAESAQVYEKFSKENPNSDLAVTAIFNAGINYERAGLNGAAFKNYTILLAAKGPQADKLKPKVKRLMAKLYQDAGQFGESAKLYKELSKETDDQQLKASFIFNSAVMSEAQGKNSEAIGTYEEFIKVNKKAKDNLDTQFIMGQLYKKSGQQTPAMYKFKEYAENYSPVNEKVVEAAYFVTEYYGEKFPGGKLTLEWKAKTIGFQKRLAPQKKGPGANWVSKLKIKDAMETFQQMKSIKIPANPQRQKEAADKKISLMTQLNSELVEVVKFDSAEEIVTSLKILADANLHMGLAIQNAPLPAGLNQQETEQYKQGMLKFSTPFMTKAQESYKLTVERGWELDVYNSAYRSAYEYMNKQDPKLYYDNDEKSSEVYHVNWMQ